MDGRSDGRRRASSRESLLQPVADLRSPRSSEDVDRRRAMPKRRRIAGTGTPTASAKTTFVSRGGDRPLTPISHSMTVSSRPMAPADGGARPTDIGSQRPPLATAVANASLYSRIARGHDEWVPDASQRRSRSGNRFRVSAASTRSSHTASVMVGSVFPASTHMRSPTRRTSRCRPRSARAGRVVFPFDGKDGRDMERSFHGCRHRISRRREYIISNISNSVIKCKCFRSGPIPCWYSPKPAVISSP